MNTQVSTLMSKEISRKEFLGISGLAVASVLGFGTAVKLLTGHSLTGKHVSSGFGSGSYGGGKD